MKEKKELKTISGVRLLLGYLGLFLIFIGIINIIPLFIIPFYPSSSYAWWFFYVPAFLSVTLGGILYIPIRHHPFGNLSFLDTLSLTVLVWIVAILVSSLPYFIWGHVGGPNSPVFEIQDGITKVTGEFLPGDKNHIYHSLSNCIFESVSGFSSTGLTLFPTSVYPSGTYTYNAGMFKYTTAEFTEFLPNCEIFFFHRGIMTFTGGVGLVLILSSAINRRSSFQLYLLEGHNDKLLPNLLKSARNIIYIYVFIFLVGTVLLTSAGVSFFDALCYSMAGVSTGGFATHSGSIGFFSTALGETRGIIVEAFMAIVMILGMLPFIIHHFFFTRQYKKIFLHYEVFVAVGIVLLFLPLFIYGMFVQYNSYSLAFRKGIFEFSSFFSTSGFSTYSSGYSFNNINSFLYFSMIVVTTIGGFTGSTAGGIKLYRIGDAFISLKESFSSSSSLPEEMRVTKVYKFGEKRIVTNDELKKSSDYIFLYLFCEFAAISVLMLNNYSIQDSVFEISSAFSSLGQTTGLSLAAANNHQYSVIWALIVSMFIGRLEIQIVFYLFIRLFKYFGNRKNIYKGNS